jgi:hypothetical protein
MRLSPSCSACVAYTDYVMNIYSLIYHMYIAAMHLCKGDAEKQGHTGKHQARHERRRERDLQRERKRESSERKEEKWIDTLYVLTLQARQEPALPNPVYPTAHT